MSGHPAAGIAVILAFAVAVLAALWLRAGRPPRDPLRELRDGADAELRALGHDPCWARQGGIRMTGTCARCAGVLIVAADGEDGVAYANPPAVVTAPCPGSAAG